MATAATPSLFRQKCLEFRANKCLLVHECDVVLGWYCMFLITPYFNISGPTKFSESVIILRNPAAKNDSPYVWHIASSNDGFDVFCLAVCSFGASSVKA